MEHHHYTAAVGVVPALLNFANNGSSAGTFVVDRYPNSHESYR